MIFNEILNKFPKRGSFTFNQEDDFATKCNAPKDSAGIYLIYDYTASPEKLIYIGSSGRKDSDGNLKVRNGGLYDRLVNGYHPNRFGQQRRIKRRQAFPLHMKEQGIKKINVMWWVTYDTNNKDFPTDVERKLESKYISVNQCYPIWHQRS